MLRSIWSHLTIYNTICFSSNTKTSHMPFQIKIFHHILKKNQFLNFYQKMMTPTGLRHHSSHIDIFSIVKMYSQVRVLQFNKAFYFSLIIFIIFIHDNIFYLPFFTIISKISHYFVNNMYQNDRIKSLIIFNN